CPKDHYRRSDAADFRRVDAEHDRAICLNGYRQHSRVFLAMRLTVEIGWILAVALVAVRFAAALALTPVFGAANVPARFRVLLILALSALVVSATGIEAARLPASLPAFLGAATSEALLGAAMAFGIFAAFAVFLLAGRIMDIQLGFGVAVLIDPTNRTQSPLLGTFLNL